MATSAAIGYSPAKAVLYNDKIYVYGCFSDNSVGEFTPPSGGSPTGSWRYISPATKPPARTHMNVWELYGDKIFMQGGGMTTRIWYFDLISESWVDTGYDLSYNNQGSASGIIGNRVYVFGGSNTGWVNMATYFDLTNFPTIALGTYRELSLKPTSGGSSQRYHDTVEVINGQLYVGGGEYPGHYSSYLSRYNPSTDSWEANLEVDTGVFGLPTGLTDAGLVYLDGFLYLIGRRYVSTVYNTLYRISMV